MGVLFRLLCQAESRRLLLLMAITLALVLSLQYFQLPYTQVFTSLFAAGNNGSFPSGEVDNTTLSNALNSTHHYMVNDTRNVTEGSNIGEDQGNHNYPKNVNVSERNNSGSSNNAAPEPSVTKDYNFSFNGSTGHDFAPSPAPPPLISPSIHSDTVAPVNTSSAGTNSTVVPKSKVPAVREKGSKKRPQIVVSISEMNDLLLHSHAPPHLVAPPLSSKVEQELIFVKSQIVHAPVVTNDSGLHPSLYRNVSMFKRSFELMESMLKVYIYQEGEKPIFHEGILDGIYASEGWFIKLLEANKIFVTEDPQKAHLFFLPFSSRLLELTLYKRNSHSRTNLIQYMRDYVDMIAAKHPFWNRTNGSDHFLVACHDWAPAETRGRLLNSIRALCNADIGVGFAIGKDVSLPETYVRSAKNPLKSQGGKPPSQRHILAFFAGNMHGYVRPVLLNYWGNDTDMKILGPMPHVKGNTNYIDHMKSSKFCICARGHEVNSPRVVEAIFYECVPVIISDNFVPPLFEVLNWEAFAVFVSEKDIPNLKNIILSISEDRYKEMYSRVKMVQPHFLWHAEPVKYDLFHMILHSIWYNRVFRTRTA